MIRWVFVVLVIFLALSRFCLAEYLSLVYLSSPVQMSISGLYQSSDSVTYFVDGQCFVASTPLSGAISNPAVLVPQSEQPTTRLTYSTASKITVSGVPTKEQYSCCYKLRSLSIFDKY